MRVDSGKTRKTRKKILSFVISLAIILTMMVAGSGMALAEAAVFAGGIGSSDNPYIITNEAQLNAVRGDLSAHYALANDIDLTLYLSEGGGGYNAGTGWLPIGDWINMFSGTFDGNGHTINGLAINRETDSNGLFGVIGPSGVIRNLGLTDVSVESSSGNNGSLAGCNYGIIDNCSAAGAVSGVDVTGGLVGYSGIIEEGIGLGNITNSHAAVTVTANGDETGGLVGEAYGCDITDSYATGSVTGRSYSGGLVGNFIDGSINGCHATGNVTAAVIYVDGNLTLGGRKGGLVGDISGSITSSYSTGDVSGGGETGGLVGRLSGTITNSYAMGSVTGTMYRIGGLVGCSAGTISQCYAAGAVTGPSDVGGLVGENEGCSISSSFYAETTGQVDTGKGVCKTVIEMRQQATYTTGWDFTAATGMWRILEGHTYPVLQWQPLTTEEINAKISMDKEALVITYATGDSSTGVKKNLTLPTDGAYGSTISWSSSNTVVVANDGTVTRPSGGDSTVILTATVSLTGGANQTRDFELTVIESVSFAGGDGSLGSPFQVTNAAQLNAVREDLSANYALAKDIDLATYLSEGGVGYNAGAGWLPIGDWDNMFSGTFDGNGYTINGLAINRETSYNGLFGVIGPSGAIRNLGLTGVSVESLSGYNGSLAGFSCGIIDNCSAAGAVSGVGGTGGLAGYSGIYDDGVGIGDITNSYAAVTVTGNGDFTGGLVGEVYDCDITDSYATGIVSGRSCSGGLVGKLWVGGISGCHATGDVTSAVINENDGSFTSGLWVGGLVGQSLGSITSSYSTGDVSGGEKIGGLVGEGGNIANSYATGAVTGTKSYVGGLMGYFSGGEISKCYAAGVVTGYSDVGGLVGVMKGVNNSVEVINSFYAETTGQVDTGKGACKTVIEMRQQATYTTGWDFTAATGMWRIIEGHTYPVLQWQPLTTEEINAKISMDKEALVITYATGDSSAGVKKNLTLPTDGAYGSTISWSSSNTVVVANDGTVTRPSGGDSTVTLTATVSLTGGTNQTRDFELTVIDRSAVSISANPAAGGTAAGGGSYNEGATVTVTATPKSGYTFENWTEDGSEVSTDASYIFTLGTSDRTLVANFILTPPDVTKGTISGMVTDGANPVQGANVSLTVSGSVYSTATIADGGYSIPNVPIGTGYTVTAAKSGYTSENATNVSVTANTTTQNVNITLTSDEDGCLVTYKGAQKRYNAGTNTYDIRFIAIINTLNVNEVGFVFSKTQEIPTRENAAVKATTTVYTSITAAGSTVAAEDLEGTYIIACTVTGIPVSDIDVPLHVRAFSTSGTVTKYTPVSTVTVNSLP